ncbi:MAG: DUF1080 domain-containing protein [Pirellulaceae bacterium]
MHVCLSRIARCRLLAGLALTLSLIASAWAEEFPAKGKAVPLFNGKDLTGWYTYTVETGRENPGIFTVVDGMLKVAGGKGDTSYFGGIVTKESYGNYYLSFEYKWGEPTYGRRKDKARDSGVLLHCVGPNEPGPWMTSYELQIIEGGTGDLLVVNATKQDDAGKPIDLSVTAEAVMQGSQRVYQPGAKPMTWTNSGRLNWYGRDPEWKDVVGFRGRQDVESPFGEWTKVECYAQGDRVIYLVNGKVVNRASGLSLTKGKIFFQTEGAEMYLRNILLAPLESK